MRQFRLAALAAKAPEDFEELFAPPPPVRRSKDSKKWQREGKERAPQYPSPKSTELARLKRMCVFDARPRGKGVPQRVLKSRIKSGFELAPEFIDEIGATEDTPRVKVATQLLPIHGSEQPFIALSFLYDWRKRKMVIISATFMSEEAASELRSNPIFHAPPVNFQEVVSRYLVQKKRRDPNRPKNRKSGRYLAFRRIA
jgi:hypothetical protein